MPSLRKEERRNDRHLYYSLHPANDRENKAKALIRSKQLEKQVDDADISDPHNLVTESPIA